MGKHERGIVEEAEIIVALLINGEELSPSQRKHPFLDLIKKFVKGFKEDHRDIKYAEAVGNTYNSPGDIRLNLKNGEKRYIELKFLEKSGAGTLANISQDAMTLLDIYSCQGWSSFRKETGHRNEVIELLNKFTYPFEKILISDSDSKIYKAADYLKELINAGSSNVEGVCKEHLASSHSSQNQKLASSLILEIIRMDKASRVKYLSILKKSKLNKDRLKKFVFLLLVGSHTQEVLSAEIDNDFSLLKKNISNYDVYYLYKKTGEIKKEQNLEDLCEIFDKDIDIEIKEKETNLVVFSLDKGQRVNLIRVVYHWKNKFGGIQTPCLNIFKF